MASLLDRSESVPSEQQELARVYVVDSSRKKEANDLAGVLVFGSEAAIEAIESLQGASDERVQQKALALQHARYEVTRARRQYDVVDPANRLVAAELERRWNQALTTEAQVEAELVTLQESRERPLTDTQKKELLTFARDLPSLWDDPHGLPEHKKRLLRIALKEIIATCEGETIRLVLHWQGGDHTQVEFPKIRTGRHRYVTDDDLAEIVRLARRRRPMIAALCFSVTTTSQ